MKKVILLLFSVMLFAKMAFADTCFVAKEKDQVLKSEGDCGKRYAAMSTFKIALSLIGFDSGHMIFHVSSFSKRYPSTITVLS